MKQGEKIKRARQYRKMTMREVGMALGFDEISSSVRMAQYENSSRSPKAELLLAMAQVLGVRPERIAPAPEDPIDAVIEHILWLDEQSPEAFYEGNARLSNFLSAYWQQRARLARHEISKTDFAEWKLQYNPNALDPGNSE